MTDLCQTCLGCQQMERETKGRGRDYRADTRRICRVGLIRNTLIM